MNDDRLLIDHFAPRFDFTRVEHQLAELPAIEAIEAMRSLDLLTVRSPLTDLATGIRTLPERLGRPRGPAPPPMRLAGLFDAHSDASELLDWVGLDEERGRQIVFGAVGMFWRPKIVWRTVPVEEFSAFAEPGWGKIVASIVAQPYGGVRSVLTYEARTILFDDLSRRSFGRYWTLVSPFAGVIMRAALKTATGGVRSDPLRT